ncbi:MAG: transposase [Actinomycetota bacterium]|nr:transposase [Actinomycetota bacterium]
MRISKSLSGQRKEKTQRYFCKDCKRYFNLRRNKRSRYTREFKNETVKRYVEDNTSLRAIAKRMEVSRSMVLNWVSEAGKLCKDPIETDLKLNPSWSGILGIDGKPVSISGRKDVVLVAVDRLTKDLVHLQIVKAESEEDFENFLIEIRDIIKYPLTSLVSDLGKGKVLVKLVASIFPNTPHQICVIHFCRYVDMILPKSKKSEYHRQNTFLRGIIKDILFAKSLRESNKLYQLFNTVEDTFRVGYQKAIIKSIIEHYELLTSHFHHEHLPRDNNVTENVIKQLNRKLKLADGYQSRESAYNHLKLWALCYRFKPFTDSRIQENNGRAPLQLAKVDTSKTDWLEFSRCN